MFYLLLFVCMMLLFYFFLPLILANAFFLCLVLIYLHIICVLQVLSCIKHSAFSLFFFLLYDHTFFRNERAIFLSYLIIYISLSIFVLSVGLFVCLAQSSTANRWEPRHVWRNVTAAKQENRGYILIGNTITRCFLRCLNWNKIGLLPVVNCLKNEHNTTNMFIFIIICFTNVFEDKHIFFFRCLHPNFLTTRVIIVQTVM